MKYLTKKRFPWAKLWRILDIVIHDASILVIAYIILHFIKKHW